MFLKFISDCITTLVLRPRTSSARSDSSPWRLTTRSRDGAGHSEEWAPLRPGQPNCTRLGPRLPPGSFSRDTEPGFWNPKSLETQDSFWLQPADTQEHGLGAHLFSAAVKHLPKPFFPEPGSLPRRVPQQTV